MANNIKVFGSVDSFAIGVNIVGPENGDLTVGSLFYYIDKEMVGDIDALTRVCDAVAQMTYIIKDMGQRENSLLFNANALLVFNSIRSSLYVVQEELPTLSNQEMPSETAVFDIRIPFLPLDNCIVFAIESMDKTRIIYSRSLNANVVEKFFDKHVVDRAFIAAFEYLENLCC